MKNILVPYDFSSAAINAYRFACDIAALSNGTVHVLYVIEFPALHNTSFTPVRSLEAPLRKEMTLKAKAHFDKLQADYHKENVTTRFNVEFGAPHTVILAYAKKLKLDLIVMGSYGASGLKEYFVGSNTEKIVRTSPIPVIVVKSFYKGPVKNIVIPFAADLEKESDFIQNLKNLQSFFKAHLHLVWINTPANFRADDITQKQMSGMAKKFKLADYTISIYNDIDEGKGIIKFADSIDADMIAMGTHGRKGLSHLIYGSKTEKVANHGRSLIWTYVIK